MSENTTTTQSGAKQQHERRKGRAVVKFVGRPRVTVDENGAHVTFDLVNRGPVSLDVGFDVKIDGQTVVVQDPSLSLGVGSGNQSVTLDLPVGAEFGQSPQVAVSVTGASGQTLAVGSSGLAIVSAPVIIGGVVAVGAVAGIGWAVTQPSGPALGTGDVQVTLEWTSPADLDLHVIDPSGEHISFENLSSASGGELDVDACFEGCAGPGQHVENVYWPDGEAPDGEYEVVVHHYDHGVVDVEPASFEVVIRVDGQPDQQYTGALGPGDLSDTYLFER
ncbi:hypothetical protein P0L94_03255 [Microbacter sp. GSS18]|nr:hypothetical protein P0L94_03255 [Microbacter sp. GSS18]